MVQSLVEWIEENDNNEELMSEVAPPGFSGTVRAMQSKHPELFGDKSKNAYALAWSMYKKGDSPHYKEMPEKDSRKGTPVKKKKAKSKKKKVEKKSAKKSGKKPSTKKGVKKFNEWAQDRVPTPNLQSEGAMNFNDLPKEDLQTMSAFQIMQKLKGRQLPPGVDPFAYAVMLKHKGSMQ